MTEEAGPPVLSVGVLAGGAQDGGEAERAAKLLGRLVIDQRAGVRSPLCLNVVFQIAGRYIQPDFRGVRTGRYSDRDRHLLVQAAFFPQAGVDATREIGRLLREAVDLAEEFARARHVADELTGLRELVASIIPR